MSLAERMSQEALKPIKTVCILISSIEKLSAEDKKYIIGVLDTPVGAPGRFNNSLIGRVLREEGLSVSNASVDRHRRAECACKKETN